MVNILVDVVIGFEIVGSYDDVCCARAYGESGDGRRWFTEFEPFAVEDLTHGTDVGGAELHSFSNGRVERTRKHPLETLLVTALLAVICGADSFVAMEDFAEAKQAWLGTFLDMSGGVPSHDTFGRVFAALDPRALAEAFRRWTMAMATTWNAKLIAIDGKTLRRSFKQAGDHSFVHMVSAWSRENRVVLGQVQTSEKSNEITAIPELLKPARYYQLFGND